MLSPAGRRSAGLGSDGVARQVSHAVGVRAVIRRLFGKGVRGGDSERQDCPVRDQSSVGQRNPAAVMSRRDRSLVRKG